MKGILLIAGGHPYYGKMAAALAATLKVCCNIPIHLAYAGNALNHLDSKELKLFSSMAEAPKECYIENKWLRIKMFMYDLSPFDETMYLDIDILWLNRSPAELFRQFKNVDLTYSNFGEQETIWANTKDVKKAYGIEKEKYYGVHSELMYFKKTDKVKHFFETALDVFDNLKVKSVVFAGTVPDELPFTIASALCKMYPHKEVFRPIYWRPSEKGTKHIYQIAQDFYGISMAGHQNSIFEMDTYNIISSAAYLKLGLQHPYKWKQKISFLAERKLI